MRIALALLLLVPCLAALAEDGLGRVRAIYCQEAPGVLVDARFSHRRDAIRWADVQTRSGRMVLVQIPAGMQTSPGELVAIRVGDPKSSPLAQVLPTVAVNRAREAGTEEGASVGR